MGSFVAVGVLALLFMIVFAIVGLHIFGGAIPSDQFPNFNSFFNSFLTMFQVCPGSVQIVHQTCQDADTNLCHCGDSLETWFVVEWQTLSIWSRDAIWVYVLTEVKAPMLFLLSVMCTQLVTFSSENAINSPDSSEVGRVGMQFGSLIKLSIICHSSSWQW